MDFFIDFEATQFNERMISVGCICANGTTFSSLVRPAAGKWKITKFITDLTGITKEMITNAPTTESVFFDFYRYFKENAGNEKPRFFCYGNCDERYVKNALKETTSMEATMALSIILGNLVDYAPTVAKYFNIDAVGLNRVYKSLLHDEHIQNHDALEDAVMLKYITENLETSNLSRADLALPSPKPQPNASLPTPELFKSWINGKGQLWKAETLGTEEDYEIKCSCTSDIHHKYFDSLETAVLWAMKYVAKGQSPKKPECIAAVRKVILQGINKGKCTYGLKWEMRGEEE